jgi:predicted branched-subunit amino acid permease
MQKIFDQLESIETVSGAVKLGLHAGIQGPSQVLFAGMVGFGAMSHGVGLSIFQATMISVCMFALPGQIVFIEMMAMGISATTIALAVGFTSTRFLTMVLTLFPQIPKSKKELPRALSVHLLAMSSWTFCMRDFPKMKPEVRYGYFIGLGLSCWLITIPGTMLGYIVSEIVPIWVTLALLFVNPLFFLMSFLDVSLPVNRAAIVAGIVAGAVFYVMTPSYALIISGIGIGSLVYLVDLARRKLGKKDERSQ